MLRLLTLLVSLLTLAAHGYTQDFHGHIADRNSRAPIPFATIKFGSTNTGTVAGLNGDYLMPAGYTSGFITVSAIGYLPAKINVPLPDTIYLVSEGKDLPVITVKPPREKIRRIINAAIAAKDANNPDKYPTYRCNIYYKIMADAIVPGEELYDTGRGGHPHHLLLSESYSTRQWERPGKLQEYVHAARFSGLRDATFTPLVTDVLPFHSYGDYITINGKDYHNPLSKGFERFYTFNLADELMSGADTLWILSFRPRGANANELAGSIHIHSHGYAIANLVARVYDTSLHLQARLEQQYTLLSAPGQAQRWFPRHLNYILGWEQHAGGHTATVTMKGSSSIDSVSFPEPGITRFDKAHTVRQNRLNDTGAEQILAQARPASLTAREQNTYVIVDSLGEDIGLNNIMRSLTRLPEGKLLVGPVYLDLYKFLVANRHENVRLGAGLQTSESLVRWLSVGGWGGYGFSDKNWKYGAFAEAYLDSRHECIIRAGYERNITTPGSIKMHPDIDRPYLQSYLLDRADRTETTLLSIYKKLGYWQVMLSASQQKITPLYAYTLQQNTSAFHNFTVQEVSLNLRYAPRERTAPIFGIFYGLGTKFPVLYANLAAGKVANTGTTYVQGTAALSWNKHFNRIGNDRILLMAGYTLSAGALPLGKLFAGNGYRYGSDAWTSQPVYAFGGLLTMLPYEYYSDRFINLCLRHDADWKLFKVNLTRKLSSAPNPAIQYNLLYGTMQDPYSHMQAPFRVPSGGYHEAGLLLNNIVRLNANICYITFTAGYFYHLLGSGFIRQNGRFSYGLGFDL